MTPLILTFEVRIPLGDQTPVILSQIIFLATVGAILHLELSDNGIREEVPLDLL